MPAENVTVTEGLDVTQTPTEVATVAVVPEPTPAEPVALTPEEREKVLAGIPLTGQPTSGSGQ